ncbi:MAG: chemotaxis protein [Chromatiales bacterium]|nr:chemotaxis protein [Chromatiales bacterium]
MTSVQSQLVGNEKSRQEMLLFHLAAHQTFGINVLKIKEIIPYERLNRLPGSHPAIVGIARLRGSPLPVIDLSQAIGMQPVTENQDLSHLSIIISEFNRSLQGFLVRRVQRIITLEWKDILPPPKATGHFSYITGVTRIDEKLVEIVDVERVLNEVSPPVDTTGQGVSLDEQHLEALRQKLVMVVDDSSMARKQIGRTLDMIGLEYLMAQDGKEALDKLHELQADGQHVDLIISDIEMPEMDGYTLTREVRKDQDLSSVYILLHTSLAGVVSNENAQASGADAALTKFVTEELAEAVVQGLSQS